MRVLNPPTATNVKEQWHVPEAVESSGDDAKKAWSQEEVKKLYRKFNIDLAPKLLYSRGALVELLISSNIARYTEFRNVTRVVTWHEGKLTPVPCSRADVFATQNITVVEKRMLMNLLQECTEYEGNPEKLKKHENQSFLDFLKDKQLTDNLIHYVLYAIAMSTEETPCIEGMSRTQKFLLSLGRYGNTPFLWPMYGSGEIPQAFCRLCAVFGGLYHLKRGAEALIVGSDNTLKAIHSDRENLKSNYLVMGLDYAPDSFLPEESPGISRGVFLIDSSILAADKEHLTLLEFPPDESSGPVTIVEVGSLTNACPQGLYMVHMTTKQKGSAEEDLMSVAKKLMNFPGETDESKPNLVWSMFFNMKDTSTCDLGANTPTNLFLTSGPDLDLDFDFAIKQAKEIFSKMYPEDEFLPRAPDPEEIILDDDDEDKQKQPEEKASEEPQE
ncbi:Hypothetical predicted protein [Cloeon dipterum]|nr:Hypothetical predicted protein [Cloeon dipterum]